MVLVGRRAVLHCVAAHFVPVFSARLGYSLGRCRNDGIVIRAQLPLPGTKARRCFLPAARTGVGVAVGRMGGRSGPKWI